MKTGDLRIGQRVRHPLSGLGTVKSLSEHAADIKFDDGVIRSVAPDACGLQPAEAQAELNGLSVPLATFMRQTVEAAVDALGIERIGHVEENLGVKWHRGRLVMHPSDPTLATKEVELEVFFHKIVMMRNNLRVLEQKVNAHTGLSDAEKFDMQQYITRCYGSMTTFNVLFRSKDDGFRGVAD